VSVYVYRGGVVREWGGAVRCRGGVLGAGGGCKVYRFFSGCLNQEIGQKIISKDLKI
jgi:hypothetical protein